MRRLCRRVGRCRFVPRTRSVPQTIEAEVVQPDGGRALVIGKLDAVPEAAGGQALRIVVCDAQVRALPTE